MNSWGRDVMTREDPYRVQAEMQKKRIPRVDKIVEKTEENKEKTIEREKFPPRRSVHHKKRKKRKFKTPVITLLVFIFILLPITVLFINLALSERGFSTIVPADSSNQFEQVDIQQNQDTDEDTDVKAVDKEEDKTEQVEKKKTVQKTNETLDKRTAQEKIEQTNKQTDEEESKTVKTEQKTTANNTETDSKNINKEQGIKNNANVSTENVNKESAENNNKTISTTNKEGAEGKVIYHKVEKGETLYRIAINYYHSDAGIEKIKTANNLQSNEIQLGQTLKIPLP
jgi:LysM repeat protein